MVNRGSAPGQLSEIICAQLQPILLPDAHSTSLLELKVPWIMVLVVDIQETWKLGEEGSFELHEPFHSCDSGKRSESWAWDVHSVLTQPLDWLKRRNPACPSYVATLFLFFKKVSQLSLSPPRATPLYPPLIYSLIYSFLSLLYGKGKERKEREYKREIYRGIGGCLGRPKRTDGQTLKK